jgi:hypothetical protein
MNINAIFSYINRWGRIVKYGKYPEFSDEFYGKLEKLFKKARDSDEFQYILTLINFEGIKGPGWEPIFESREVIGLIDRCKKIAKTDEDLTRLYLLSYCHVVEMRDLYKVIFNLYKVIAGDYYNAWPFAKLNKPHPKKMFQQILPSPAQKIKMIENYTIQHELDGEVINIIKDFYNNEVRNAFYHSHYILYNGEFRDTEFSWNTIPIKDLAQLIKKAGGFYNAFMRMYGDAKLEYREEKVIEDKRSNFGKVKIISGKYGLEGFEQVNGKAKIVQLTAKRKK